jgi:hypothetical protein
MNLPQTGGCQCGKVRYEITEEPQSVRLCWRTLHLRGSVARHQLFNGDT